ncbi:MAG TPA: hypothetical protein VGP92_00885 [Acidimicrobiia bacterium]|nr:hypothetical protein [Acidimicrobiia bacterium]
MERGPLGTVVVVGAPVAALELGFDDDEEHAPSPATPMTIATTPIKLLLIDGA